MYDAKEIALWFVYKNNSEMREQPENDEDVYEGISPLKLQKLLYYAQGISLSMTGKKLFHNKIYAWEHGPVVKEVYQEYKKYGRSYIDSLSTPENDEIVSKIENDYNTSKILNIVYDNFAIYTAWQLRNMTHVVGSPWYCTPKDKEISTKKIEKYFNEVVMEN